MDPRDRHMHRRQCPSRRGPIFYLLLLLVLSSFILFTFTYRHSSGPTIGSLFETPYVDPRPIRDLSIELHPKDHIRRLPTSLTHHWNITKGVRAPDGVNKAVYLINGQFPGPTLEARTGDQIVVTVSNQLQDEEGVAIHWHGLHMKDANHMDGVVGVTQKEIPAGRNFTYVFEISKTQAGTFWYHSHSELQRADGLFGGLIIHRRFEAGLSESEEYEYEDERLLLVGDWYHRSAVEVQASYLNFRSSGNEPVPDSMLINGLGAFNCSMAVPSRPIDCEDLRMPSMKLSSKPTRLRVVNVGAMSGFNFTLESGDMRVIKIDGGNSIVPSDSVQSVGILYPGERMDIINSGGGDSLAIALDPENFQFMNQALTTTKIFPIDQPTKRIAQRIVAHSTQNRRLWAHQKRSDGDGKPSFDLSTAVGMEILEPMPQFADQTVLVYTHIEMLAHHDHAPMGYMNRTNWIPQAEPLIYLPREQWDEHQFVPAVNATEDWVDIVVNNIDDKGHPFHLHGHDFYVLTRHAFPRRAGYRTYNPFDPPPPPASSSDLLLYPKPNMENPPLKDTIHIPRRGYVILRIRANNIGVWMFHCHIIWHQGTGMAMALDIR